MLKHTLYIALIITCFLNTKAQTNLVPNPSFEDTVSCPDADSEMNYCLDWTSYSASPDYYNSCATFSTTVSVPSNWFGYQQPKNGNAYAAFFTFVEFNANYREIIGAKLTSSLNIGTRYYFSFFISFGGLQEYTLATDKIGLRFSSVPYSESNPTPINNFAHWYCSTIITDTVNWVQLKGSYIPDSAYKYIAIGNFFDDAHIDTLGTGLQNYAGYYYIDNVCLSTDSLACNGSEAGINTIPTNQALFYYDSYNKKIVVKENSAYTLQLIDAYGNKVNELKLQGAQSIDVSTLPSGCYIMLLSNQQGNSSKKFMVSP